MPDRQLIIHAGLPKTGTTSLQRSVFPRLESYLGGTEPGGRHEILAADLLALYQDKFGHPNFGSTAWHREFRSWWDRVEDVRSINNFVSLEALFRWFDPVSGHPWPLMGEGTGYRSHRGGTHPIVSFASALVEELGDGRVKFVLTLRNQADFAISLYAQLSYRMLRPGQVDFERKIEGQLNSPDSFFDWFTTISSLSEVVGAERLLLPVFEDGLESVADSITRFVDGVSPGVVPTRANVRSSSDGWAVDMTSKSMVRAWSRRVWPPDTQPMVRQVISRPLRGLARVGPKRSKVSAPHIEFPEALRRAFQASFRKSNSQLAEFVQRDLAPLGY
jgi:hypothetical protein